MRPAPAAAFEVTGAAVSRVREVVRGHGVPDGDVSTSRLDLQSSWSYGGGERQFLGYECTASFVIELRELDALERLLVDVVEAGANHVEGVEFDVRAKRELRARAREAAVADALEKAELYARAAGVRLGPVVRIRDVDSEQPGTGYVGHSQGGGEGSLAPGAIRVSAGVLLGPAIIGG
ncbi:SIMPL domain-containing protein [Kitasatospora sp. NPDC088548]|uniref:SIMPL domain-containing protein n=1 Tax=Kitasatospora sp. NPDC088548 TaxID=3364075 RepID=UPI0037FC9767